MTDSIPQSSAYDKSTFQLILFRSGAYALAAYFISLILERALLAGGAFLNGYAFIFSNNRVKVIAPISQWNQDSVISIYLLPYFFLILFFIVNYIRFITRSHLPHTKNIFNLWLMFFLLYRVLGVLFSHILYKSGVYHALAWLYMSDGLQLAMAVLAMIIFLPTGFKILRGIMVVSATYHLNIMGMGIPKLMLSSFLLPLIIVCVASLLFHLPALPEEELPGLGLLVILGIFCYFRLGGIDPNVFAFKEKIIVKQHPLTLFIIVMLVIASTGILLATGVVSS